MNMFDAADADTVAAMYGCRRAGAHYMRYVEFVLNPTAGSLVIFCSSGILVVVR